VGTHPAPQCVHRFGAELGDAEAAYFDSLHPPGQGLTALPHQFARSATKYEESGRAAPTVGKYAQDGEEVRAALDLVDDDQPLQRFQCRPGFVQARQTHRVLQVEIVRRILREQLPHQGRLPSLPGTDEHHDRVPRQSDADFLEERGAEDFHGGGGYHETTPYVERFSW